MITCVGVQPLFQRTSRKACRQAAISRAFEIQILGSLMA
jgi:hypothetical protein